MRKNTRSVQDRECVPSTLAVLVSSRELRDTTTHPLTNIYQAPTNVAGVALGARHTRNQIAARPSKGALSREAVWCRDSSDEAGRVGGLGPCRKNKRRCSGGRWQDAGNGVRLFPALQKEQSGAPPGYPICKSGGLGIGATAPKQELGCRQVTLMSQSPSKS